MTNNKRFGITTDNENLIVILDNDVELSQLQVCDKLNELNDKYNEIKEQYADDCNEANSMTVKIAELTEEKKQLKLQYSELEITLMNNQLAYNDLKEENEQLKQYNQQITKILEDGGVILTKNQLNSLITMKNDDSVEVRHLKTVNAKLKDEIRALREYIQKKELKE